MSELEKLKKQFEDEITKNLEENFNAIIDVIVESFGEEYREIITSRMKEINILFYIETTTLESAIARKNLPDIELNYYRSLLNELKEDTIVLSMDPNVNRANNLKRRTKKLFKVIGNGTLTEVLKDEETYKTFILNNEELSKIIGANNYTTRLEFAKDEERKHSLIILPFLKVSDKTLIHEIIHLLGFNEKLGELRKTGLIVLDAYDDKKVESGLLDLDEYYVEKKSIEIQKKLQERGISILPTPIFDDYSSYNNLECILGNLVERYDWLFAKATFSKDKDVLNEILGYDLLRKIAIKVYEAGMGSGYSYLGKYAKSTSDEIYEEVTKKVGR